MARTSRQGWTRNTRGDTGVTGGRVRGAAAMLNAMGALDGVGESPESVEARLRLREKAAAMGMTLVSMEITREVIPDPVIEGLPRRQRDRIERVARRLHEDPGALRGELEELVAKHPGIPTLRNFLVVALNAVGEVERADAVVAETSRLFPGYLFGFCNRVMALLHNDKVEEARAMVETGPRGPLFILTAFDPSRNLFHISEAVAYTAMVGHYLISTGRATEAKVQLKMLRELEPDHPQTRSLADRLGQAALAERLRGALEKLAGRRRNSSRSK